MSIVNETKNNNHQVHADAAQETTNHEHYESRESPLISVRHDSEHALAEAKVAAMADIISTGLVDGMRRALELGFSAGYEACHAEWVKDKERTYRDSADRQSIANVLAGGVNDLTKRLAASEWKSTDYLLALSALVAFLENHNHQVVRIVPEPACGNEREWTEIHRMASNTLERAGIKRDWTPRHSNTWGS